MAVNLSPVGGVAAQFFTSTGAVLTGGKLYTYAAGTTTPAVAYTASNGATAWSNPIVLDAAGRVPNSGEIWLSDGIIYKFVLKDSTDVLIATYDNISGINSNFVAYTNNQEIFTATAGQTVFTLANAYQPGTNSLSVFVDGVNQYGPSASYAYVETDSNTVTFNAGLHVGAEVKFTTTQQQGAGAVDAQQVSYQPPFTGAVATNVEAKLAQTVSVKDFGAVGDGVTDDTAAIQAAVTAAGGKTLFIPEGVYLCTSSITSTVGITIIGDDTPTTVLLFDIDSSTDGLVLNKTGVAVYPTLNSNATGFKLENFSCQGVTTASVKNLVYCDNIWKVSINDVWAYNCTGNGFNFNQCLHVTTSGIRSDQSISHAVDCTAGTNTTITMISPYLRATHSGAGIKSNCLGLTLISPIIEGIGGGSGSDVYVPGIWISGGNATIVEPYFEDVRGHNIFIAGGTVVDITGGQNTAGAGTLNARYSAVCVNGSAQVTLNGAGYAPGGGNKVDVKISSTNTGNVFGTTYAMPLIGAADITDPLNYTAATYDVANYAAILAIPTPSAGQSAYAQDSGREYTYDGSTWTVVAPYNFNGGILARNSSGLDGNTVSIYGKQSVERIKTDPTQVIVRRAVLFDAGASYDNVAAMQSGAAVAAYTSVTSTKSLGYTISGYSGSTAKTFAARFNTPLLPSGIDVRVNILGSTSVQIVVYNYTNASVNLNSDVRGQILIERYEDFQDL
jgi:hypothetical protein